MIVAEAAGSANGLGVVCLAQFLGEWILLKLWSVRGEFSQKFSGVCAASVDFGSSFGDVISCAIWPWRDASLFGEAAGLCQSQISKLICGCWFALLGLFFCES